MKQVDNELLALENEFGDWFNKDKFSIPKMTKKLYPYTSMFSPIKVNRLEIKNRLVMGPMGNVNMADETGRPSEKMIKYFEERAKGGVGLITTGLIPTTYGIDSTIIELDKLSYFPRIDRSRTNLVGWRNLAYAVHNHGAKIFIQLTAGLGRVGNPECLIKQFRLPVSSSWNPNFYISQIPCRKLSDSEIKKIIKKTGQAAADSKACGLDGVYLHGHEGYLIEQLSNPAFNRRKLGRYSNYQQFGIDMVKHLRERVGDSFPIMYRIDLSLMLGATYGDRLKNIKQLKKFRNERTIAESLDYMKNLVKAGVDMFDVDLGCYDNWWLPHPPSSMPSGCFLDISKMVKDFFKENGIVSNAGVEVPVVAVGKLGYPDLAEKALRDNKCDMVMLARPLLADSEWVNKAYRGDTASIRPCIGCHEACIKEFVEGGHPQCAVNPMTAFESEIGGIKKADKSKKVAVVGGGPAGVVAAETLIARGHSVDLYEKSSKIGGTLIPASVPKIKYELANYVEYLNGVMKNLQKNKKFNLLLKTQATESNLKGKYDAIVFATGSYMAQLPIPGAVQKHVKTTVEVLSDKKLVTNADNVVIIGGGDAGVEVAYYLAYEHHKNVSIVEMEPYLMKHTCTANRGHLLHYLEKAGVQVYNCASVSKIDSDSVEILRNVHRSVPSPFNTWQPVLPDNIKNPLAPKIKKDMRAISIPSDLVVMAAGTKSNNELYFDAVKDRYAEEIYNVGDSNVCGKVYTAVKSAFNKCLHI